MMALAGPLSLRTLPLHRPRQRGTVGRQVDPSLALSDFWVAVKELNLSYHIMESYIYTHTIFWIYIYHLMDICVYIYILHIIYSF